MSNSAIQHALETERVIDITTTGRKTGKQYRKEIWFHNLDGDIYITGSPGRRGWYANLLANPEFTFHLKQSVQADLPAHARPITDHEERVDVLTRILERPVISHEGGFNRLNEWVERSPLVEVKLELENRD